MSKRVRLAFITICSLAVFCTFAQADTVQLTAVADTRITPYEDVNWNSLWSDAVYHESGNVQQSLIQFDLSGIPAGARVLSATLQLTERDTSFTSQGQPTWAFRVTRAWNETEATGSRATAGTLWTNLGGDFVGTTGVQDTNPYGIGYDTGTAPILNMDVKELVRSWVEGGQPNYGLLLRAPIGNHLHFYSREFGSPQAPQLTVNYTLAPTRTIFVRTDGNDNSIGDSWATAKATVKAGLDLALEGDEVHVGKGTYLNCVLTVPAGVTLLGGYDPSTGNRDTVNFITALSGNSTGPVIHLADSTAVDPQTIDGFTITAGNGGIDMDAAVAVIRHNIITQNNQNRLIPNVYMYDGGGIRVGNNFYTGAITSSATITDNTITQNSTYGWGGGILVNGPSTVSNNLISGNFTNAYPWTNWGGGIAVSGCAATITDNTITGNYANDYGGGIGSYGGVLTVRNNVIRDNSCRFSGAGIEVFQGSANVTDCVLQHNVGTTSTYGGGMATYDANITIDRCKFINNQAANNSGAIEVAGNSNAKLVIVSNSLFDGNYAGQYTGGITVASNSDVRIIGNTVVNNSAGIGGLGLSTYSNGTSLFSHPLFANNIVAFNQYGLYETAPWSHSLTRNNCIFGNGSGNTIADSIGDIYVDPQFMNFASGNYRLSQSSPCVDTGNDSFVDPAWHDFAGGTRTQGAHVDIGALEGDYAAPVTTENHSPLPNAAGWNNQNVTVNLSAVDNPGSGVMNVSYSINSAPATVVPGSSASFVISTDGTSNISYFATDYAGNVETAHNLTIKLDKTPPAANAQSVTTSKNTPVGITLTGADATSGVSSYAVASSPAHGALSGTAPNLAYTPTQGYFGPDSFTFTVTDVAGNQSSPATVSITVTNTSSGGTPPTAVNDSLSTANHTPLTFSSVLANDTSANPPITILTYAQPANGTVTLNPDGTGTYTPTGSFSGTDKFTYTITDAMHGVATATVNIAVATNKSPNAVADSASTQNPNPITVNVLANDTDPEGDALHVTGITQPVNGNAVLNADGTVTYTPNVGFKGSDSIIYSIADNYGGTASATLKITVTLNGNPIASNDGASTPKNTPVKINVLLNDSDPNGYGLTVTSTTTPDHGSVTVNPDNTLTYTPPVGYRGKARFDYTISNGHGGTATATVTVTVG